MNIGAIEVNRPKVPDIPTPTAAFLGGGRHFVSRVCGWVPQPRETNSFRRAHCAVALIAARTARTVACRHRLALAVVLLPKRAPLHFELSAIRNGSRVSSCPDLRLRFGEVIWRFAAENPGTSRFSVAPSAVLPRLRIALDASRLLPPHPRDAETQSRQLRRA